MIFHTSKIIFIHIPKTGGTTIEQLLIKNRKVSVADRTFGVHHRLEQVFERWAGEDTPSRKRKDISSYHMFVVARNPWERYASMYIHDVKTFIDGVAPKPSPIEEYMEKRVEENFFKMIEVKGSIPDNFMILNFDDFENEVVRIWKEMGLSKPKLLHENKKESEYHEMQAKLCQYQPFQEAVAELCAVEIALFEYDLPS